MCQTAYIILSYYTIQFNKASFLMLIFLNFLLSRKLNKKTIKIVFTRICKTCFYCFVIKTMTMEEVLNYKR